MRIRFPAYGRGRWRFWRGEFATLGGLAHGLARQLVGLQVEGDLLSFATRVRTMRIASDTVRPMPPRTAAARSLTPASILERTTAFVAMDHCSPNELQPPTDLRAPPDFLDAPFHDRKRPQPPCGSEFPSARIGSMTALQDQLDEITANTRRLVQAERMAINERAVRELFESGIEEKILPVGATAPEFTLNDASGRPVRSADLLALGPLVLNFFRGRWCPYCITEIEAWRDLHPRFASRCALGRHQPANPAPERFHGGPARAPFPVLVDPGCTVAAQFGLAYTIPPYHRDYYRSILVNIPFVNGDDTWRLILPATYEIGRDGTVLYARRTPTSACDPSRKRFWLRRWTRWQIASASHLMRKDKNAPKMVMPLWDLAVLVRSRRAVQHPEYDQYDGADEGDEDNQPPPAALSGVVEPAHADRPTRDQPASM